MEYFFQLEKADFAGEFTGVMAALEPDGDREIINWSGTVAAVRDWSAAQAQASGGKSYGNIRGQHDGQQAIGKLVEPPIIDEKRKLIIVHGKVVDPTAKELLQEGVYTGLSIGGAYASKRPLPNGLTEYIPALSELSLVDKPCSPSALLTVTRADGSVMQKAFKNSHYGYQKKQSINKTGARFPNYWDRTSAVPVYKNAEPTKHPTPYPETTGFPSSGRPHDLTPEFILAKAIDRLRRARRAINFPGFSTEEITKAANLSKTSNVAVAPPTVPGKNRLAYRNANQRLIEAESEPAYIPADGAGRGVARKRQNPNVRTAGKIKE